MKKIFSLIAVVLMLGQYVQAQQDPVIIEIGDKKICKSEFMKEFLSSIGKSENDAPTPCTYEKRQALEDYVRLYVNYQVKLADAYRMGYDRDEKLNEELATYRAELAAPYLIDSASMERIMREAYDRSQYALHAAHILIKMKANPSPADTLRAYNKTMEVYRKAVAGEDFFALANQVMDETSMAGLRRQRNPREGDLGCFTVFDMVYPFETAAYSLQPGQISRPVRTRFGYHVIKLFSRTRCYGTTELQHIWVNDAQGTNEKAEGIIRAAYAKLQGGESFESVAANYSDDRNTASKGGFMPKLPANQLPPDYVLQSENLKEGQTSQPFHTQFGWHIIKLVSRESRPSFEEMIPIFKQRMARDPRNEASKEQFASNMKQRFHFQDYVAEGKASLQPVVEILDSSVFEKGWKFRDSMLHQNPVMMVLGGTQYRTSDFCRYIQTHQEPERPWSLSGLVEKRYAEFTNDMAVEMADKNLEKDHPEFAQTMAEYLHGLMIFSYNENEIWKKAVYDTVGFLDFYDSLSAQKSMDDPDKDAYFWDYRARVTVAEVADSNALSLDKALKVALTAQKKQWSGRTFKDALEKKCAKTPTNISVNLTMVQKGDQTLITENQWKKGVYAKPSGAGYQILIVEQITDPCLKSIEEARGYYLSEYQDEMERRVTARLRDQFGVKIHQEIVDEITY